MASATDKARFFLEQTVPELREWERREIFAKPELTSIASQRTHFETLLNSREATPALYVRYLTYEHNLSALLSKRLQRLHLDKTVSVKSTSGSKQKHKQKLSTNLRNAQQRRIMGLLERATRRFYRDLGLWMQYVEFCKDAGSHKRLTRTVTEMCRQFATEGRVWRLAARIWENMGDVSGARGAYLRGVRFCPRDQKLAVDFARAEMRWVEKSRQTLGLRAGNELEDQTSGQNDAPHEAREDVDADMIALPTAADLLHDDHSGLRADTASFPTFSASPAMTGAIPIAIFDNAMKQCANDEPLAEEFFDMFAEFGHVPCTDRILRHIADCMSDAKPHSSVALGCKCRIPIIGVAVDDPRFPNALRQCLSTLKSSLTRLEESGRPGYTESVLKWMDPLSRDERLVPELKSVITATTTRLRQAASTNGMR